MVVATPLQVASSARASNLGDSVKLLRLGAELTVAFASIPGLQRIDTSEMLSSSEQRLLGRMKVAKRRREWLAGRVAAKSALGEHLWRSDHKRVLPADLVIHAVQSGPRAGQPWSASGHGISISHSAELAVSAVASRSCGIDVERIRPLPVLVEEALASPGDIPSLPLALRWACKESVLKASGMGLRFDLRWLAITSYQPSGRFEWQTSPEAPPLPTLSESFQSWAGFLGAYALALVWS